MDGRTKRTTAQKLAVFGLRFSGLRHVYGSYDAGFRRARQVKSPVDDRVFLAHLKGKRPYGVFLLDGDRTRAVVADFDDDDLDRPMRFVEACRGYGIPAYVERSKSKGYHVWVFFPEAGVSAAKARLVVRHILSEIGHPNTEVFPKHDALNGAVNYGNFINAPLFGGLVPEGRTVFLDLKNRVRPFPDQWDFLENVELVREDLLDDIIGVNELDEHGGDEAGDPASPTDRNGQTFGLPPCARRMLAEGVTENQRVACFRLGVSLKKAGLPQDLAVTALRAWASKNKPTDGKRIITDEEIAEQVGSAYAKGYRSCGCDEPAVAAYCSDICPLHQKRDSRSSAANRQRPSPGRRAWTPGAPGDGAVARGD